MTKKRYAFVRGRRATDDLLSAEISSPAGHAFFNCPDCGETLPILADGDFACGQCGSVFVAQAVAAQRQRERFLIRRKPAP